jgi:hypothetical protein
MKRPDDEILDAILTKLVLLAGLALFICLELTK